MQAYLLVQTQSAAAGIARELRTVPGVILAEDLRGPYDAIALARSDPSDRPLDEIIAEVRKVPDVTRTISAPLPRSSRELGHGEAA